MDNNEAHARVLAIVGYKELEREDHERCFQATNGMLQKAESLAIQRLDDEIEALRTLLKVNEEVPTLKKCTCGSNSNLVLAQTCLACGEVFVSHAALMRHEEEEAARKRPFIWPSESICRIFFDKE